jgi:hypothetical protein
MVTSATTTASRFPARFRRLTTSAIATVLAATVAAVLLLPASAPAAPAGKRARPALDTHPLLHSRLLWATIDICSATDQPDTVGVRGSMPGDGEAHDTMYMRFRLQYMNTTNKVWTNLSKGASSSYSSVGSGVSARQAGRSFQLNPIAGQPAFTLRGVVSFQWRRGKTVLAETSRPTSAGRESLAGSDPADFSAATCMIG